MIITTATIVYSTMIITAGISPAIDQEGSEQWSPVPQAHWDCLLALPKHPYLPSFNTITNTNTKSNINDNISICHHQYR